MVNIYSKRCVSCWERGISKLAYYGAPGSPATHCTDCGKKCGLENVVRSQCVACPTEDKKRATFG
jgi:hypothetical protein